MMSVGLHCRLVGRPGRAACAGALPRLRAAARGVWVCRRIDIARHWHENHPVTGRPRMPESLPGPEVFDRLDELARFTDDTGPAHPALPHPDAQGGRPPGAALDGGGRHGQRGSTPSATWSAATRRTDPAARRSCSGSHIDTVRNAGKYDGNFGVIAAIEAVAELHGSGERLPFAIEVLAFGDEEGVRFPVTLTGSRAVAGTLDRRRWMPRDADGISVREALQQFGCDPADASTSRAAGRMSLAYVELHIEQGPVLEAEDLPVGVVTAINGARRFTVEVTGMAGHAGTVPMRPAPGRARGRGRDDPRGRARRPETGATRRHRRAARGAARRRQRHPRRRHFTIDIRSPSDAARTTPWHGCATNWPPSPAGAASSVRLTRPTRSRQPPAHRGWSSSSRRGRARRHPALPPAQRRRPRRPRHGRAVPDRRCCSSAARTASATTRPKRSPPRMRTPPSAC